MSATQQQEPTRHRADNPNEHRYYPEDEIELMDYLLVIWKWKYLIIAGTLAFALTAAIISFITWKQQPTMYRTSIVLKPGILKIDETGNKVFIDTPENIKALIENDLKYKVLDNIKTSNNTNLSNSVDFQVDIPKSSNTINVSSVSAFANEGTTKLNYLIKALSTEFANKIKFKQEGYEKEIDSKKVKIAVFQTETENFKKSYLNQIELKKTSLANLKKKEVMVRKEIDNTIQLIKYELDELSFKEKMMKAKIEKYQQELSDIEVNKKLLQESKDNSQSKEYFLKKLSMENDYRNTFHKYFELNEIAKYNLFELQKIISTVSKEIKDLEKTKSNIKADPYLQPNLYKIQKDIINVSKELEKLEKEKNNIQNDSNYGKRLSDTQKNIAKISKEIEELEKEKQNIQNIQIIQPPVTTEIPKNIKIKRNVSISSIMGFFLMLFISYFGEYLSKHKKRMDR